MKQTTPRGIRLGRRRLVNKVGGAATASLRIRRRWPVRTSAKAIVLHKGKLLLVKLQRPSGPDYILPGGGPRRWESLHAALVRECREETGVIVEPGALRFVREYIGKNHARAYEDYYFHQVELWFTCKYIGQSATHTKKVPDPLQDGFVWVPLAELHSLTTAPAVLKAILTTGSPKWPSVYLGDVF